MDSPRRSEANNQIIISGISSKSREDTPEQGSPSVEQGESSESADPPATAYQLAVADHDREYGCRYCHKKFSNKQALGGHQNAHKVERAMEKETGGIGYYDDDPNPNPYPYPARMNAPAPYHRHPEFLHRTSLFSWSGGRGVVAYNPRPGAEYPYSAPSQGWSASALPARPHCALPGQDRNVRLPNFGPGSSGAFGPIRNAGFVIRPRCSNPAAVNLRNVPGNQHDESGLDLSLKLG